MSPCGPRLATVCSVLITVTLLTGCGERAPADASSGRPVPTAPKDTAGAVADPPGLSAEERRELSKRLEEDAERAITPDNAEAVTTELEQEIQADIGHE